MAKQARRTKRRSRIGKKDSLPFLDLNLCFSAQLWHHIRGFSGGAGAAPVPFLLQRSVRLLSPNHQFPIAPKQRVTLKITAPIKATYIQPKCRKQSQ